jgi:predicted component of type VI protein secretion system
MEKAADELEKAEQVISATLKDNSVRKRLLQLLPSIVSHLVINLEKNAYAVVFHNGKQSEWRKVAAK